ncbi:MAG: prepilin-type N-terminal cleavage/methylation domain-containing protein [Roseibacillus sp.]
MNYTHRPNASTRGGFTLMELLVVVAIVIVLATIAFTVSKNMKESADLARATQKIKNLGEAFVGYTADSGGLLPYEDAVGPDDWNTASKPEASEAWYNALTQRMGVRTVGELASDNNPEGFYQESYPLYVPGAPYPKDEKKFRKPYFAIAMNSRLQRRDDDGNKEQGTLASIQQPVNTVVFLERGMPGDKKVSNAQRGFDAGPKANPRAFAGRHNQKGILLFVDGHVEVRPVSDLITRAGRIIFPQEGVIWTRDPEEDPN